MTDAASSGRLVPTATMVRPMTSSDTPNSVAMWEAAQTSIRDDAINNASPPRNDSHASGSVRVGISRASISSFDCRACCATRKKNSASMPSRTRLFDRESSRSYSKNQVTRTTTISRGRSIQVVSRPSVILLNKRVTPNTSPTLAMLDPKALPTASSPESASADMMEIRISGAEVPTETMVRPMSMGVRPARFAMAEAPSTKRSALQTSATKPTAITVEYHNTICFPIPSVWWVSGPSDDRVSLRAKACCQREEGRSSLRSDSLTHSILMLSGIRSWRTE